MRKQIQVWAIRAILVIGFLLVVKYWGVPAYKQYFVAKKTAAYIPTTKVKEGPFVVSFHEIGTLEAEKSVVVSTETGGRIISLVEDGVMIQAGDTVVVMDTSDMLREVRNAQLALKNAEAEVQRAYADLEILKKANQTEVDQAKAQLAFDQAELDQVIEQLSKKKRLAADKLVPQDQVDQAELQKRSKELAVTKGEMALTLKEKEVASKEQQKQADIAKLEFATAISKSNLDEVESRVNKAAIKAPAGGLVVISKTWSESGQRTLQEGDTTRPRQVICTLPSLSTMLVKVQVGESDAPKIELGLPVLIKLEAVPKKVYHGTVSDISRLATEASYWETNATPGRKNFEVTITVKEVDPKTLNPGMTADVEFICSRIEKSVYVPIESVIERDGKTYVFVKEGSHYRRTRVSTGKENDNFICITKGLQKNQVIALRDPSKPLEEQEAGTAAPKAAEEKKKPAPIPEPTGKK